MSRVRYAEAPEVPRLQACSSFRHIASRRVLSWCTHHKPHLVQAVFWWQELFSVRAVTNGRLMINETP